ncbi:hypothetical protein D3C71_1415160 [compost metagenome]
MIKALIERYRAIVAERQRMHDFHDIQVPEYSEPTWNDRFKLTNLVGNRHNLTYQLAIHIKSSIFEVDNFRAIEAAEEQAHEQLVQDGMEKYRDYFIGGYVSNNVNAILVVQANDINMLVLAKLAFS